MNRSCVETVPASATFDVGEAGISDAQLARLRAHPDVAWAARRTTREVRWRKPGLQRWGRGLFFIIEDMARQGTEVAVMKALGATGPTIARMYASLLLAVSVASLGCRSAHLGAGQGGHAVHHGPAQL